MSSILPLRSEPQTGGQDPRVVDLDGDEADAVFSALSSGTAREIISALHQEPRTQSEIADAIDTSVQNVRYHLDNLEEAGLVEVVDTWYSSRGNEMKVYAPADAALIVSGDEGRASRLKAALSRLVGGIGVVAMASLLVQVVATRFSVPSVGLRGSGDAAPRPAREDAQDGADGGAGDATETDVEYAGGDEATRTHTETVADDGGDGAATGDAPRGTEDGAQEVTANGTVDGDVDYSLRGDELDNSTFSIEEQTGDPNETFVETGKTTVETLTRTTDVETATREATAEVTRTTTEVAAETAPTVADGGAGIAGLGLPPGLAFFLGAVSVLVVVVALWYWSGY